MKITHAAVGLALAATTAARGPAACAGPDTTSSTPASTPTSSAPAPKTVTDWVVLWEMYSRDDNDPATGTTTIYCHNRSGEWRAEGPIRGDDDSHPGGSPCPTNLPVTEWAICLPDGRTGHASSDQAAAEADGICPQIQRTVAE